uniref:Lectin, galactoside-binding-like b n=1 Tax=Sinocyclocheilus rhinocerous TaxID=307959 RepID=A0A673MHU3_9TELE
MAVASMEKDAINTEDDVHLNNSFGDSGFISPDKEDISRILTVPFSGRIRGGMRPGKKIIIMGIIDPEPDRYVFISKLHTFKNDSFDLISFCSFSPLLSTFIQIEIHCEHQRFRIFVDGHQLFDFYHKVKSLPAINMIRIVGSLQKT